MFSAQTTTPVLFAPPCPKCKTPLEGIGEKGAGVCGSCVTPLEFVLFPARNRVKPVARAVRSIEGDATCFFHEQNQAASVCESCGRYVCVVCEVPSEDGRKVCPPCLSSGRKKSPIKASEVVLYGSMATGVAIIPMIVIPATLITAPIALFLALYGWKKPRSLIRPGPARFIVATVLAGLQICGWIIFGLYLWVEN